MVYNKQRCSNNYKISCLIMQIVLYYSLNTVPFLLICYALLIL